MEALTDAIGLGMLRFGFGVINIIDRQIQLVRVTVMASAILGSTIGKHPQQSHRMLLEKGQDLIVKQLCGGERGFHRIQLRVSHFRISVEEGLLIDASDPFKRANIEGILGTQMGGMGGLNLPVQLITLFLLLQGRQLSLG